MFSEGLLSGKKLFASFERLWQSWQTWKQTRVAIEKKKILRGVL